MQLPLSTESVSLVGIMFEKPAINIAMANLKASSSRALGEPQVYQCRKRSSGATLHFRTRVRRMDGPEVREDRWSPPQFGREPRTSKSTNQEEKSRNEIASSQHILRMVQFLGFQHSVSPWSCALTHTTPSRSPLWEALAPQGVPWPRRAQGHTHTPLQVLGSHTHIS